jgi:hypothetical protein
MPITPAIRAVSLIKETSAMIRRSIAVAVLGLSCLSASATDYEELVVFRGLDGKLAPESRRTLDEIGRMLHNGTQLRLWVGFDIPFEADPALRTLEVVAAEAAAKNEMIQAVIGPLAGDVEVLATPTGIEGAPGCMVRASESGLRALSRDTRVVHISAHPSDSG